MTSTPVALGKTVKLNPAHTAGKTATIKSDTVELSGGNNQNIDNTAFNLINNLDGVLLHFSIRRQEDTIVLNSRRANGPWETEERFPSLKRAFGPNFDSAEITIKDLGDDNAYEIFVNGNYLTTYKKRIGGEAGKISYSINSGQSSVLANPIHVTVQ